MEIKKISKPGNEINEDCATTVKNGAWVLDGATGLNNKELFHKESDAKGLVKFYDEFFKKNYESEYNLSEIVKDSINNYWQKLQNYNIKSIDAIDIPSSGAALVRWNSNQFNYLVLGDCIILIELMDGSIKRIYDERLEKLDSIVLNKMDKLIKNKNYTALEAVEKCKNLLITNRQLKNKKEGYWVLGIDDNAVDNALTGAINLKSVKKVILATDGFYALVNKYNEYSERDLFEVLKKNSINSLYNELREIESKDNKCTKYVRFKKSDDASLIYIDFQHD